MHPSLRLRGLAIAVAFTVAGWSTEAPARADVDGEPDPSFSGDGLLANGNEPYSAWTPRALAVLKNQEVVVVGDLETSVGMDHLRISVPGDAITTCQAGIFMLAEFEGLTALVDRAGRLVVAGRSTFTGAPDQERGLIGRFTATNPCAFDTGWSDNGWQILDGESFCDAEDCVVLDVAEVPTDNAQLFALLSSRVNSLVARLFVVAFQGNGEIDATFGVDGYAEVTAPDLGTLTGLGAQLVVDGGERPLVLASRHDPDDTLDLDPFLFRFTADGDPDASFGDGGFAILDDTSDDGFPVALVLSSNGAVGYGINLHSGPFVSGQAGVLMPDGAGDDFVAGGGLRITAMAAQGDGKFLVLFDEGNIDGMVIARLRWKETGLVTDFSFGNAGNVSLDVDLGGADWEEGTAMVLSTGRPWLAGRADGDSSAGMFAMRVRSRFVFADGFELGSTFFWRR